MSAHVHFYVHVSSTDWMGHPVIVCRCSCGSTLTPEQILAAQSVSA